MTKNLLFAVVVLSLALAVGCATGGNGIGPPPPPTITVNDGDQAALYPNQTVTFTATVGSPPEPVTVTWSLSGSACTGSPNPCGSIDPTTGVYQAPANPPTPSEITITATSPTNSYEPGIQDVNLVLVSVVVTPLTVSVGQDLVQQFTAVAVPDDAPQTFNWTCTPSAACGGFAPGPNNSGLAVYTAPSSSQTGIQVTATSTVTQSPAGVGTSKVSVVTSRLTPGTYAFQFSGYDTSNHPIAAAGSLTVGATGTITGIEDVLNASGPNQYTVTSGSYVPGSGDNFSNGQGVLKLNLTNGTTNIANKYTAVVTSVLSSTAGALRMIESDGLGTGSGVMQQPANGTQFNTGGQTFAFGFTGVDSNAERVGYVGLLPITPNGNGTAGTISGGLLDANDNGTLTTVCGTPPCSVTGSYTLNAGVWQMTLTSGSKTLDFDFYISAGTAQTKTGPGPLTLYAISTDPVDATHPAISGSMVYQVPMASGYNNAAFSGTSVSALTGANANVSLTVGTTDGTSGGTGGAGGFTGGFDQNNNGTILSVEPTVADPTTQFTYTYVASSSATGRYIFQMLGNPTATPVVAPINFVLYASGANRGFLLDQNTAVPATVMTGTMTPQPTLKNFQYAPSELPGTYAAETISNSDPSIAPVVQNLLLTSTGNATYNVAGIQNPGNVTLTGAYTIADNPPGLGAITLTAPSAATYVIYAIDASAISGTTNDVITDFMMMGTCTPQPPATTCSSGPPSSIIFAQQ
jgi:hypothetical protein